MTSGSARGWLPLFAMVIGCESPAGGAAGPSTATPTAPVAESTSSASVGATAEAVASGGRATTEPGASSSASAAASAARPKVSVGLHADGNDPDAVIQIETVRDGCVWTGQTFAASCKLVQGWVEWAAWPGRQELLPTLATVLLDDNPAVRHLAAKGLEVIGQRPIRDVAIATKLYDALEAETNPNNCRGIGMQAGTVRLSHETLAAAGFDKRAAQAARSHRLQECREVLVANLGGDNPQLYDLMVELAKSDAVGAVRRAAMGSMRSAARKDAGRQRNNCEVWLSLFDQPEVTARVVELVGGTGIRAPGEACAEQWDALLTKVEGRVTGDRADVSPFGLVAMLESRQVTEERKERVVAICKKIVADEANHEARRSSALHCVGSNDPEGKAFAKRFVDDPADQVKQAARRIVGEER